MMTSTTVPNPEKGTNDEVVVIDIYEELEKLPTNDPNSDGVCVCHLPKSLSSMNPEAFIPQFVGLGPYHHFRDDLAMTRELRLGVVKRFFKLEDKKEVFNQRLQNIVFDIQPFYHEDMQSICDSRTLSYVLTVDGLFLLALLHSGVNKIREVPHTYFLTGKPGTMPLVNASGVELTVDGIIREVFMIENQIPTHVLKKINDVSTDEINDLGSAMKKFCETLCPLVNVFHKLPENPEDHDHLLDLLYHLVVPPHPESEPKSGSEPEFELDFKSLPLILIIAVLWLPIFCLILVVQLVSWFILFLFRWVFKCLPRSESTILQSFTNIFSSTLYLFLGIVSKTNSSGILPEYDPRIGRTLSQISKRARKQYKNLVSRNSQENSETIPSTATELHKASITFKPADGSISSIQFHEKSASFDLPCIRLDGTSEVIIRNLLAYESLTKSSDLTFTKFVKLLTTLIYSAEDVKLLVDKEIIRSQLSNEAVTQLFTEMRKSIDNGPAQIKLLEQKIMEGVMAKIEFDRLQRKVALEFIIPIYIFTLILVIYPWLLSVITSFAASVYCMFHSTSTFCTPREHLSSM